MAALAFTILAAAGLVVSFLGSRKALHLPIFGGDKDSYLSSDPPGITLEEAKAAQQHAWWLLLGGLVLQLVGAAGLAVLAFAR